ncbi:unnamed protein product [Closterium sp. Naga37s-1]|nr:unnamed protein product [Closterium sp. Naga37s-1]
MLQILILASLALLRPCWVYSPYILACCWWLATRPRLLDLRPFRRRALLRAYIALHILALFLFQLPLSQHWRPFEQWGQTLGLFRLDVREILDPRQLLHVLETALLLSAFALPLSLLLSSPFSPVPSPISPSHQLSSHRSLATSHHSSRTRSSSRPPSSQAPRPHLHPTPGLYPQRSSQTSAWLGPSLPLLASKASQILYQVIEEEEEEGDDAAGEEEREEEEGGEGEWELEQQEEVVAKALAARVRGAGVGGVQWRGGAQARGGFENREQQRGEKGGNWRGERDVPLRQLGAGSASRGEELVGGDADAEEDDNGKGLRRQSSASQQLCATLVVFGPAICTASLVTICQAIGLHRFPNPALPLALHFTTALLLTAYVFACTAMLASSPSSSASSASSSSSSAPVTSSSSTSAADASAASAAGSIDRGDNTGGISSGGEAMAMPAATQDRDAVAAEVAAELAAAGHDGWLCFLLSFSLWAARLLAFSAFVLLVLVHAADKLALLRAPYVLLLVMLLVYPSRAHAVYSACIAYSSLHLLLLFAATDPALGQLPLPAYWKALLSLLGIPPALTPQAITPPAGILLLAYAMARARSSLQQSLATTHSLPHHPFPWLLLELAASCPPPMAAALQLKPHPDSLLLPPSKGPPWPYLCLAYPSALATEANTYFILTAFFTILTHMHPSAVSLCFLLLLIIWVWLFLWPSSSRTSSRTSSQTSSQLSHQTSSHAGRSSSALHSSSRTSVFRASAPALRAYMAPLTASFAATVLLLRAKGSKSFHFPPPPPAASAAAGGSAVDAAIAATAAGAAPASEPVAEPAGSAAGATSTPPPVISWSHEQYPLIGFFGWVSFFKRLLILHCPTALPCAAFFAALYPVSAIGFGFLLLAVLGCVRLRAVRGTAPRWMFLYGGAALVVEFGFQVVVAQWGLAAWVDQHSAILQWLGLVLYEDTAISTVAGGRMWALTSGCTAKSVLLAACLLHHASCHWLAELPPELRADLKGELCMLFVPAEAVAAARHAASVHAEEMTFRSQEHCLAALYPSVYQNPSHAIPFPSHSLQVVVLYLLVASFAVKNIVSLLCTPLFIKTPPTPSRGGALPAGRLASCAVKNIVLLLFVFLLNERPSYAIPPPSPQVVVLFLLVASFAVKNIVSLLYTSIVGLCIALPPRLVRLLWPLLTVTFAAITLWQYYMLAGPPPFHHPPLAPPPSHTPPASPTFHYRTGPPPPFHYPSGLSPSHTPGSLLNPQSPQDRQRFLLSVFLPPHPHPSSLSLSFPPQTHPSSPLNPPAYFPNGLSENSLWHSAEVSNVSGGGLFSNINRRPHPPKTHSRNCQDCWRSTDSKDPTCWDCWLEGPSPSWTFLDHWRFLYYKYLLWIVLILVFATGTLQYDLLHCGYLALSLLSTRKHAAILRGQTTVLNYLRAYNFLLITASLVYQCPYFPYLPALSCNPFSIVGLYKYDYGLRMDTRSAVVDLTMFVLITLLAHSLKSELFQQVLLFTTKQEVSQPTCVGGLYMGRRVGAPGECSAC